MGEGTTSREGLYEEHDGWICAFLSFGQLPGESEQSSHTHSLIPSTPLHLHPSPSPPHPSPHLFPLSPVLVFLQGLTMNPMKKLLERKASPPRYLAAGPYPGWAPQSRASAGLSWVGRGFPEEGRPLAA